MCDENVFCISLFCTSSLATVLQQLLCSLLCYQLFFCSICAENLSAGLLILLYICCEYYSANTISCWISCNGHACFAILRLAFASICLDAGLQILWICHAGLLLSVLLYLNQMPDIAGCPEMLVRIYCSRLTGNIHRIFYICLPDIFFWIPEIIPKLFHDSFCSLGCVLSWTSFKSSITRRV